MVCALSLATNTGLPHNSSFWRSSPDSFSSHPRAPTHLPTHDTLNDKLCVARCWLLSTLSATTIFLAHCTSLVELCTHVWRLLLASSAAAARQGYQTISATTTLKGSIENLVGFLLVSRGLKGCQCSRRLKAAFGGSVAGLPVPTSRVVAAELCSLYKSEPNCNNFLLSVWLCLDLYAAPLHSQQLETSCRNTHC
jgi:hypothetical protein